MKAARWILARLAPAEWRESLEGDLSEERLRRLAKGQRAGWVWSVLAALSLALVLRREARAAHPKVARRLRSGEGLWQDVRLSVRSLRAAPGFTAVAVIVLALGIGAATAIFSVVDAVLLRGLPFEESDRLLALGENDKHRPPPSWAVGSVAAPTYADWLQSQTVFESMAASTAFRGFIAGGSAEPEPLIGLRATASLFDVLRVRPQRGQVFTADQEVDGRDRVVLISDGLWRRRFAADPDVVGRMLTLDSGAWRIIGVLPRTFVYPVGAARPTDVIAPYVVPERQRVRNRQGTGRNYTLRVIGRLKPGATTEHARSEMTRITSSLAARYPDWFEDQTSGVVPLHENVVGRARSWMLLLLGSVACVLLIACANVANLMLARATIRSREMLVRAALGASRWRLARSLLVESLVLGAAGLAAALVVALWVVRVLRASMPASIPRVADVGLDHRVLAAAAAAALITGVICGLVPALQLSRPDLQAALREGGRSGTPGRFRQRLRSGLVIAEVAMAVILLVGAGLFTSSFVRLVSVDLGIDYRQVVSTGVNPRVVTIDDAGFAAARAVTTNAVAAVLARVRAMPGVEAVAAVAGGSPLSGSYKTTALTVVGGATFDREEDEVQVQEVSPGYFDVVRQPVKRGRVVDARDGLGAPAAVVLNEEAAARYFRGQEPMGRRVTFDGVEREVIGIVGNVRPRGPEVPVSPAAYVSLAQSPTIGATVVARVTDTSGATAAAIRAAVLEVIPDVPVHQQSLEESLRIMLEQRRFNMLLVGVFGVLAIVIASAGVYGVMAYTVAQQTQEIGVRMALGALPQRVLVTVLARASVVMLTGSAIGLVVAWAMAGTVELFLFSVKPHDPVVFMGAAGLLVLTGLIAALVPALRAARVDPIVALRSE